VDIEKILAACSAHGVAVEINANPWRLDLDWRWPRRALELGCMMSINPDAHSTQEIDLIHWGIEAARKGGVPPGRVLNALTLQQLTHLRKERQPWRTLPLLMSGVPAIYRFEAGGNRLVPTTRCGVGISTAFLPVILESQNNLPLTKFTPGRARM
jgi:hypothetical protein